VLRKLKAFIFFLAILLAVVLEGSVVDWLFGHRFLCAILAGRSTWEVSRLKSPCPRVGYWEPFSC
jgi:hypothetical protein